MKTIEQLNEQVDVLQRELIDAKVDNNIKDDRIRQLEQRLKDAYAKIREYEIGTLTMRTLALEEESDAFNPRQTGTFNSHVWKKDSK